MIWTECKVYQKKNTKVLLKNTFFLQTKKKRFFLNQIWTIFLHVVTEKKLWPKVNQHQCNLIFSPSSSWIYFLIFLNCLLYELLLYIYFLFNYFWTGQFFWKGRERGLERVGGGGGGQAPSFTIIVVEFQILHRTSMWVSITASHWESTWYLDKKIFSFCLCKTIKFRVFIKKSSLRLNNWIKR